MSDPHDQHEYRLRVEWGPDGVTRLAATSAVVVVVDVMSFGTAVDVAVGRGASVLPVRWRDERAREAAARAGAVLGSDNPAGWSLSPSSLVELPAGTRLALPSPNGATLSALAAEHGVQVLAGCLRNAPAVAAAAAELSGQEPISVIPAGERWPPHHNGQLRPALEDLTGAGAVVHALLALGAGPASPEALAAADAFTSMAGRGLAETLTNCSSGRELIGAGRPDDVALAVQHNVSKAAPVLTDGEYRPYERR